MTNFKNSLLMWLQLNGILLFIQNISLIPIG